MKKKNYFMILLVVLVLSIINLTGCSKERASNKDSYESLKEKGSIVMGLDDTFAPMGFRDDNGDLVGFDVDLAEEVFNRIGLEVEFQPIDWSMKETELNSGNIDVIWNGYSITEERKEKVNFTEPYLENAQVIAVLEDSDIQTLDDLEGKLIGLQALSSAMDAFEASPIADTVESITEYKDNVLALNDLEAGRVDAVVIDEVAIDYYMTEKEGTFRVLDESLAPEQYGVGVRKEDEELLNRLQEALDQMNEDGTAAEISEKWFGEDKVLK